MEGSVNLADGPFRFQNRIVNHLFRRKALVPSHYCTKDGDGFDDVLLLAVHLIPASECERTGRLAGLPFDQPKLEIQIARQSRLQYSKPSGVSVNPSTPIPQKTFSRLAH